MLWFIGMVLIGFVSLCSPTFSEGMRIPLLVWGNVAGLGCLIGYGLDKIAEAIRKKS